MRDAFAGRWLGAHAIQTGTPTERTTFQIDETA